MLDKMKEYDDDDDDIQVPFNTILFSDDKILSDHERQTVLEYVQITTNSFFIYNFFFF